MWLAACSASPPLPAEPTPAWEPPAADVAPSSVVAVAATGEAVNVDLAFAGVGALYRTYFAHEDAVRALGIALGGCLESTARVVITYDNDERIGRIVLDTGPKQLICRGVGPGAADVAPMLQVTRALAAYRDTIAASRDFRVASFRIGLTLRNGARLCTAWAGGQYPPDGSSFSPCVVLAGVETCLAGDPQQGVVSLNFAAATDQQYWAGCLDL